ncbi:hypothetical protein NC651_016429 [Populus alba x Populus x berolinensis]|nr:hypothetical protein NC651_016429 [Populus alba x Populus x berolinensis]
MDFVHGSTVTHEKKTSVLQGDNFFFNRVISRDSSVGFSSRRLYYRSAEGVPFKWEMQPGTPKDPSKEDIIPPIRPPPALLGIGLPTPCIDIKEPKTSMRSRFRFWFWKHIKKNKRNEKPNHGSQGSDIINANDESDKFESSSSSLYFSNGHSRKLSRIFESASARDSMQKPRGCIPWNSTAGLISVAKRNR